MSNIRIKLVVGETERWINHIYYEYFRPVLTDHDRKIDGHTLEDSTTFGEPKKEESWEEKFEAGFRELDLKDTQPSVFNYDTCVRPKEEQGATLYTIIVGGLFDIEMDSSENDEFFLEWIAKGRMEHGYFQIFRPHEDQIIWLEFWDGFCVSYQEHMSKGNRPPVMKLRISPAITRNRKTVVQQENWKISDIDMKWKLATVPPHEPEEETKKEELPKTIYLHFLRRGIRYVKNTQHKKCNDNVDPITEPIQGHDSFVSYYTSIRPGYLYIKEYKTETSESIYSEYKISETGSLTLLNEGKNEVWEEGKSNKGSKKIPCFKTDNKSIIFAIYSEVRWSAHYANEIFFESGDPVSVFDGEAWYNSGTVDGAINGNDYLNSYYTYHPILDAFNSAHNSYVKRKDTEAYEMDAFLIMNDSLGQISDLCYETLHSGLSITSHMLAPLLDSTAGGLLSSVEEGKLNEFIEKAPAIDPESVSLESTNLKAREEERAAINDAKSMIIDLLDQDNENAPVNLELEHYQQNDIFLGKFRVLQIMNFLGTPNDLVDFMIKDENTTTDVGVKFLHEFILSKGERTAKFYTLLTERIEIVPKELSEQHYSFWAQTINIFGSVAMYKTSSGGSLKRLNSIMNSMDLILGPDVPEIFEINEQAYHVEEYILDLPRAEKDVYEKKYNLKVPQSRRFVFAETYYTQNEITDRFFAKSFRFNWEGLDRINLQKNMREHCQALFELIQHTNQKAILWLSEDAIGDTSIGKEKTFTKLTEYSQYVAKRQFGINGDNPNGSIVRDAKDPNSLLYSGYALKRTTEGKSERVKVYALSSKNLADGQFSVPLQDHNGKAVRTFYRKSKVTGKAVPALKLNGASTVPIEPFLPDGSVNSAFVKQSDSGEVLLLKSKYLTNEEKSKIIISGIHKAHDEFLNHPVTQGAIFVLTSVVTAGMAQGVATGSQMLSRNILRKLVRKTIVKSSELTAKTIGAKAAVSVSYQALTQGGDVNLFTVIGDSFFIPFVGAAIGNTFTLNVNLIERKVSFDMIFIGDKSTKYYVSAITKTIIAGTFGTLCGVNYSGKNYLPEISGNLIMNTNINALAVGAGYAIEK